MTIHNLIQGANYKEALKQIDESQLQNWKKLDLKIKIYFQLHHYKDIEKLIEKMKKSHSGLNWVNLKANLHYIDLVLKEGRNSDANKMFNQMEFDVNTLDMENIEELEVAGLYYHLGGTINLAQGLNSKSEDYLLKAKALRSHLVDKTDLAGTLNNLGVLYRRQGLLHESIDYFQNALIIFEEYNNEHMIAMIRNNLGVLHSSRGELLESKKYHEENLVFYTEKGDAEQVGRSLNNLGTVYRDLGDYEYAEKLYRESIDFRELGDNPQNLFSSYYNLSICLIEAGKRKEYDYALMQLEKLMRENSSPLNRVRYEYVVALSYYHNKRLKGKLQAMSKFEKLAEMDQIDHDVTFKSIMILIELLFFELISLNNPELLREIEHYLDILEKKTIESSHYLYFLKSKLLRAKLSIITGEIEKAEQIYNEALNIATVHELTIYKQHIHEELNNFREEIQKWVELTDKQQNLMERIHQSMITDYLQDVKQILRNEDL